MTDKFHVIKSLLLKTVSNGCTEEESKSARAMAEKLAEKYGFSLATIQAEIDKPYRRPNPFIDIEDYIRRASAQRAQAEHDRAWAEAARRRRQQEEAAKAKAKKTKPQATPKFYGVGEFCEWHLSNTKWSYETIAEKARMEFGSETKKSSIAWYASQMKKRGVAVPKRDR